MTSRFMSQFRVYSHASVIVNRHVHFFQESHAVTIASAWMSFITIQISCWRRRGQQQRSQSSRVKWSLLLLEDTTVCMSFKSYIVRDSKRLHLANLVQVDRRPQGLWISSRRRWCVWQLIRAVCTAFRWHELNVWILWKTVTQTHLGHLQGMHDEAFLVAQEVTSDIRDCFQARICCRIQKLVWSRIQSGLLLHWNLYWFASVSLDRVNVITGLSIKRSSVWRIFSNYEVTTSRFWILLQIGASTPRYKWSQIQLTDIEARLSDFCNIRTWLSIMSVWTSWHRVFHAVHIVFTAIQAS